MGLRLYGYRYSVYTRIARMVLADLHLAPMIGYFTMADSGRMALESYPAYAATDPGLATLADEG